MDGGHGEFVLTEHSGGRGKFYGQHRASALASTSRTHSKGSRHERPLVLVDGRSIVSPSGVPLRARTCASNPTPQQMGGEQWRQVVPDLWMDLGRGFGVEYRQCGLQSSNGARVMGQNLGHENGMNRTSVDWRVSLGTQYITRISFGLDSHADGCHGRRQQAYLLESGWGLYGVECQLQLAVCEFERPISSLVGISCDASLARVLRCRHQQHGRGSHHGSLARNQVPPSKHHALWTSTHSICLRTQRSGGNRGNADGRNQWGSGAIWRRAYPPNPPL